MRIGLSLAMNSANRLMMNSTRKIHSDQKPRALARKFTSLRAVSGRTGKPRKRFWPTGQTSRLSKSMRGSTST